MVSTIDLHLGMDFESSSLTPIVMSPSIDSIVFKIVEISSFSSLSALFVIKSRISVSSRNLVSPLPLNPHAIATTDEDFR